MQAVNTRSVSEKILSYEAVEAAKSAGWAPLCAQVTGVGAAVFLALATPVTNWLSEAMFGVTIESAQYLKVGAVCLSGLGLSGWMIKSSKDRAKECELIPERVEDIVSYLRMETSGHGNIIKGTRRLLKEKASVIHPEI